MFAIVIMALALSGCNNKVKEKGESAFVTDYIYPKYDEKVIITDLGNVDMEFYYGQVNCICDFRIISTVPLEKEK